MFSCYKPFVINREGTYTSVPCGKCANCKKRKISGWAFRLIEEERICASSSFITLTYEDSKVPLSKNGLQTIDKKHMQLFMKRLRKRNTNQLKYYLCGEYGGRFQRPHYHMILFNAEIKTIEPAWDMGHIHYGEVSEDSIFYTLKYLNKRGYIGKNEGDDRIKEFSLMSKGLGKTYAMDKKFKAWHQADIENRLYCNLKNGNKIAMPRYLKEKIYTREQIGDIKCHWTEKTRTQTEELVQRKDINEIMRGYKQSIEAAERRLLTEK